MSKRVLLVEPPWARLFGYNVPRIPIGLASLGAVLEEEGHVVEILLCDHDPDEIVGRGYVSHHDTIARNERYFSTLKDLTAPIWDEIRGTIRSFRPDVVGISAMTTKYVAGLNVARIAKEVGGAEGREIRVIIGGPHATALSEEVAREPDVDVVFTKEAERSLPRWMRKIDRPREWSKVPGIVFVDEDGQLVDTGPMRYIEYLDELPFQARDRVRRRETLPTSSFGYLFASRGCPFSCSFCSSSDTWSRKVRYASPSHVVEEIQQCHDTYGTRVFSFEDDVFPFREDHALEICEKIVESGMDIRWSCETRVDVITPEIARALGRAGCTEVRLGVETGDPNILKSIKKRISPDHAHAAARHLREAGIDAAVFFMVGFPDDTEDSLWRSLEFMKSLDPANICFSKVTPYPATELYDRCLRDGLLDEGLDWSHFFHQSESMHIMKSLTREEYAVIAKRISREVDLYNQRRWAKKNVSHPLRFAGKAARYLVTDPRGFVRKSLAYLLHRGVERERRD